MVNGLKEEIRAQLKLHESRSLSEIMDRALLLEEKNLAFQKRKVTFREKRDWGSKNNQWMARPTSEGGGTKPFVTQPNQGTPVEP